MDLIFQVSKTREKPIEWEAEGEGEFGIGGNEDEEIESVCLREKKRIKPFCRKFLATSKASTSVMGRQMFGKASSHSGSEKVEKSERAKGFKDRPSEAQDNML